MGVTNKDIALFVSFCLEEYKTAKHISGQEASDIFSRYEIFDYLGSNFDVLHTQSRQWLLEEIDEYINCRKSDVK